MGQGEERKSDEMKGKDSKGSVEAYELTGIFSTRKTNTEAQLCFLSRTVLHKQGMSLTDF